MTSSAEIKRGFLENCDQILSKAHHVKINQPNLVKFAESLKKPEGGGAAWNEYLSKKSLRSNPLNFTQIFSDLLVITAQNAGYLYKNEKSETAKWEKDGSGAKALLEFFNQAAEKGIFKSRHMDFSDWQHTRLKAMLHGTPLSKERMHIFLETRSQRQINAVSRLEKMSKRPNGYEFNMNTVEFLANNFPKSFGDDPLRKKAVLLLMMAAGHLRSRGVDVVLNDLIVPADYRIPETLNAAGVIEMSDKLVERIERGELFVEDDPAVAEIRAASIKAVDDICRLSGLDIDQVDLALWMASRDGTLERLKRENNTVTVAAKHLACRTMWF